MSRRGEYSSKMFIGAEVDPKTGELDLSRAAFVPKRMEEQITQSIEREKLAEESDKIESYKIPDFVDSGTEGMVSKKIQIAINKGKDRHKQLLESGKSPGSTEKKSLRRLEHQWKILQGVDLYALMREKAKEKNIQGNDYNSPVDLLSALDASDCVQQLIDRYEKRVDDGLDHLDEKLPNSDFTVKERIDAARDLMARMDQEAVEGG